MKTLYKLEKKIGLGYFATSTPPIYGKLRLKIDDFFVDEIGLTYPKNTLGGDYTHFTMEKLNLDTIFAIKAISKTLRISSKRLGYAGNKDRRAITRQRVSCWKIDVDKLKMVHIPKITLSNFTQCDKEIYIGDLEGNKFRIIARDISINLNELENMMKNTVDELSQTGIPNYFGYQRFGIIRPNNHLVGLKLIKGDLEGAIKEYLCKPSPLEKDDAINARQYLEDSLDYKGALKRFPLRLNYERAVIHHLHNSSKDFAGALRQLPRKLSMIFVHSYQSYLFNKILSHFLKEGEGIKSMKIPLLGYQSSLRDRKTTVIVNDILDKENIRLKNFWIKSMPELSCKGAYRAACVTTDVKIKTCKDDLNPGKFGFISEFILPKGCYATVVMREFLKTNPLNY
jgi:tRNA pseudouridine13 synthase|tara:strand:- start:1568 stop:2761 length:1194 start_codon:yes stop_codon:yes gene_type:complete